MSWIPLAQSAVGAVGQAMGGPKVSSSGPVFTDPWGMFDSSGWAVATGKGTANATATREGDASMSPMLRLVPWLVGGVVAIAAARAWAKR